MTTTIISQEQCTALIAQLIRAGVDVREICSRLRLDTIEHMEATWDPSTFGGECPTAAELIELVDADARGQAAGRKISNIDAQFTTLNYADLTLTTQAGDQLVAQADAESQLNIANAASPEGFAVLSAACIAQGLPSAMWIDAQNDKIPVTAQDMQALYQAGFQRKVSLSIASNGAKTALRAGQTIPAAAAAALSVDINGSVL